MAITSHSIFLDSAARLWTNYKTDYAPLVNYAKKHNLVFVATNVARYCASMVSKARFKVTYTLPAEDKSFMAPPPVNFNSTPGEMKTWQLPIKE